MHHPITEPVVLARFPRIRSSRHSSPHHEPPTSHGRWIGQASSFKLLALAALILVAVAVVPLAKNVSQTVVETPKAVEPVAVWQPKMAPTNAAPPALAAAAPAPVTATPAPPPKVDTPKPVTPPPEIAKATPTSTAPAVAAATPNPAAVEAPTMSTWPNPSHPTSAETNVATRPSEPKRQL
jgi:hypothetical protein